MSEGSAPIIKEKIKLKHNYTNVYFKPDLTRFGMKTLDQDIIDLMARRVYDIAGVSPSSVQLFLN